jgi:AraC-like DNA-binding protein
MASKRESSKVAIDWMMRAVRYDEGLSPATPVYCHLAWHPEQTPLEIDVHDGVEVGFQLTGGEERQFQDFVTRCGPGDVWLCAMWEPHGWRVTAPATSNIVLIFLPEFLGDERIDDIHWLDLFAVAPRQRPWVTNQYTRQQMLALACDLDKEIRERRRGWLPTVRVLLLRALLLLRRDWQPPRSRQTRAQPASTHVLSSVMPAVNLVHLHPDRRISTDEAARACGLSRAQFNRVFRRAMAMSFGAFCLRARLALAAHLLLTTRLPIEEIALRAGFANGSHLQTTFLRYYGDTPGRYRARARRLTPASSGGSSQSFSRR